VSNVHDILHTYLQASRRLSEAFRTSYGKLGLTYPQSVVLAILGSDGPMPISALAEAAGSANSTISGVIDRLEKLNLAQRTRAEFDRRVIYVDVTDHFRDQFSQFEGCATDRFERALSNLTPEEQDQVLKGLELLDRALESDAQQQSK
jgi:DNA-binding MarR family transcriptional regulator